MKKDKRTWTSWLDVRFLAKLHSYLEASEELKTVEQFTTKAFEEFMMNHPLTSEEQTIAEFLTKRKLKEYGIEALAEKPINANDRCHTDDKINELMSQHKDKRTGKCIFDDNFSNVADDYLNGNITRQQALELSKLKNTSFAERLKIYKQILEQVKAR